MSRSASDMSGQTARFPRVSGDEPGADFESTYAELFSPRERG